MTKVISQNKADTVWWWLGGTDRRRAGNWKENFNLVSYLKIVLRGSNENAVIQSTLVVISQRIRRNIFLSVAFTWRVPEKVMA